MIAAYCFVAAPDDILGLRSLSGVPEDDLIDVLRVPGADALEVLRAVVTASVELQRAAPLDAGDGAAILELGRSFEDALLGATDVELRRAGAEWATVPPWQSLGPNVFDLSEMIVTLAENYRRAADPEKRLFAWLEPSPR